jgi:O-antigen/teichoic acid export membrane protein
MRRSSEANPLDGEIGPATTQLTSDAVVAARNSFQLGASLAASWAIGLVGRLIVPRHLGPQMFGAFQFADSFAASFLVLSILGFETYIRKEVSARREHASEFFGGLLVLRLLVSVLAVAIMLAVISVTGKPASVRRLVLFFSAYQVLAILNGSYACLLNAVASVGGLATLNVLAKSLWAAGIVTAALLGQGAEAFAAVQVLSEALKAGGLTLLVRREINLRFRIDLDRTREAVLASLPFSVVGLSGTLYATADLSLMAFLASDIELGWYGAASSMTGVALVLAPIIHSVFLPMTSRAAARSDNELTTFASRTLEVLVSLVAPIALFGALGADVVILTIFGRTFAPAARSFRILCPVFLLTYIGILPALLLTRLERGWTVTRVSIGVLALNLALNCFAIPFGQRHFGPGGAGIASAGVWLFSETCNVTVLLFLVSSRFFDRRNISVFAKTAFACTAVLIFHGVLPASPIVLAADAVLYVVLIVGTKAIRTEEVTQFARLAFGWSGRKG